MSQIPDINDTEMRTVRAAVSARDGKNAYIPLADTELRLEPGSTELTACPPLYRSERGAHNP